MDIVKVVAIGIIGACLSIIIKQYRPEFGMYISIITGFIILFYVFDELINIVSVLNIFADRSGIKPQFILILLKLTGIAYLTEFGMNICKDCGETAIASKLELGGKVIMITLSIPVILALIETITNILD